jgi:hypothetical protein
VVGLLSGAFLGPDPGYKPPSRLELLFEEEPVDLDTFVKDKKFLAADWDLSPLQKELVMVGERVLFQETFDLMAQEWGGYWATPIPMKNNIVAQWGKGGGKDSTVRVISARVAYLLLCLRDPQKYYGMPEDDSIHLLNIAVNAAQAQRAFFAPLSRLARRSPWFKDRAHATRDTIDYAKNIQAISGHSDAESQEGLNILLGVADEIDAFKAKGEMTGQGNRAREASTSAESILDMIESSAMSRFPSCYKRIAISYPRYQGSTIQNLTTEAKADVKENGDAVSVFFASGPYATWEVNPTKKRSDFDAKYRKNPDEAAAKYECKPKRAVDAYFKNPVVFRHAADRPVQPILVDYKLVDTAALQEPDRKVRGWEPIFTIDEKFKPVPGARYAIHADLAVTGDRAGVAMSHIEKWEDREITQIDDSGYVTKATTTVPIVRNDFVIAFEADAGATDPHTIDPDTGKERVLAREIQIRWVRDLIYKLIELDFYIGSVTYDGFQSVDSLQILERHGIETDRMSTDRDPSIWRTAKDLGSDARLHMPWSELLQKEIEALSKIDKGKVDHPPGGSKDLADAWACSLVGAILLGGEEDDDGEPIATGDGMLFPTGGADAPLFGMTAPAFGGDAVDLPFGMAGALKGSDSFYGY